LVLRLNGSTNAAVAASGSFTFSGGLPSGTAYSVAVLTQPSNPTQSCSVIGGGGTVATVNVTSVNVSCGVAGRFAYVTNNGLNNVDSVSGYSINQLNGMLTPIAGTPVAAGHTPQALIANPNGSFLYAGNFPGPVAGSFSVYAINSTSGALSPIAGSPFSTASSAINMTIVPSGNYMITADFGTMGVSVYALNTITGAPTLVTSIPFAGSPTCVAVDPNGRFVYLGTLGGSPGTNAGTIRAYELNATTGGLTALSGSPYITTNAGFRDVKIDPTGRFLFAVSTFSGVHVYTLNSTTGAITPVAGSPFVTSVAGNSLAMDPTGNFLYIAHDSSGSGALVSAYSVNQTTGALTPVAGTPVPSFDRPFGIATDPSGNYAYVTNPLSNVISVFALNKTTGALTSNGSPIANGTDTNPARIVIVR
jgi:6-phosphogluconolactonase (cycloisomerase 2 family)